MIYSGLLVCTYRYTPTPITHGQPSSTRLLFSQRPRSGVHIQTKNFEELNMKKVLALVVAAAMGLSSVAFAAETTAAPAPAASTTAAPAAKAPAKHVVKKTNKKPAQKAQAAKKHKKHAKKAAAPAAQKAQAAKKHVKHAKKAAPAAKATPAA